MSPNRKFSAEPDPEDNEGVQQERAQLDSGLNFMFLAAFPLLLWIFEASFAGIATAIALIWILSLALRLISVGQHIQFDYERADVARAPRVPRKFIGSVLIGLVVVMLAGHKFNSLVLPFLAGGAACFLSLAAFGLDPRRDKGTEKSHEMATLEQAEDDMVALADRVAALDDAELTLKIEAARERIMRPIRAGSDDHRTLARIAHPVKKVTEMLCREVTQLETDWTEGGRSFARRRFLAKLDVLSDGFEALALKCGVRGARDVFERQADILIDRMPTESAA
jgi:hypothetical protein